MTVVPARNVHPLPDSYWAATAGSAAPTPPLAGDRRADICIVGGGYAGLSAALHLAEAGAAVILLEAAEPGWGASGRNGGQIIPGFKAERRELVRRLGEGPGGRLFDWSGCFVDFTLALIERHGIACQASRPGWIQPAHSAAILRDYERRAAEWQARGVAARILDAAESERLLGTGWYKGAYLDPRGGRLQPLSYARGLARAALKAGAKIHGDTLVRDVTRGPKGWRVAAEGGVVEADRVLLCTNAYSAMAGGDAPWPGLARSVVPVPSYMVATAPLGENVRRTILPEGHTAADLKRLTNHFRLEPDGRLLFGGRGGLRDDGSESGFVPVIGKLREFFPQLGPIACDYYWSGRVALTLDHVPHLHEPAPGLHAALGCNGRGVGMATAMGKVAADRLLGRPLEECPVPVSPIRPIPFHGFRLPAMQVTVWWKALRDARERAAS
jgi:glycine/D-amino acid oxidase-like deaminating enzyme